MGEIILGEDFTSWKAIYTAYGGTSTKIGKMGAYNMVMDVCE